MNTATYRNLMNEGCDGYNPEEDREERTANARYQVALERDGWTLEGTKARRAAWNDELARAKKQGRKINLLSLETKMGWTLMTLKAAVAHYGL